MANLKPKLANLQPKLADIAKYAKSANYLASCPPIQVADQSRVDEGSVFHVSTLTGQVQGSKNFW